MAYDLDLFSSEILIVLYAGLRKVSDCKECHVIFVDV